MTNKEYNSEDYIVQKLRESLEGVLRGKIQGGCPNIRHSGKTLSYNLAGANIKILVRKIKDDFYAHQEIVPLNPYIVANDEYEERINLSRSKAGRLSNGCLDDITNDLYIRTKEFIKKNIK